MNEDEHWRLTQVFLPVFGRGLICTRENKQRPKKEPTESSMINNY